MKLYLFLFLCVMVVHAGQFTSMSLEELANFDTSSFDCNRSQEEFVQMEDSLKQWQDIIHHKKYLDHDIQTLLALKSLLHTSRDHQKALKYIKNLKLPHTKSKIGLSQVNELKSECSCLNSKDQSCDQLLKLLELLILQMTNVRSQCQQHPITVIKIKGHIKDLEIIRGGCGSSQTISFGGSDDSKPTSKSVDDAVPDSGKDTADEDQTEETTTTTEDQDDDDEESKGEVDAEKGKGGETDAEKGKGETDAEKGKGETDAEKGNAEEGKGGPDSDAEKGKEETDTDAEEGGEGEDDNDAEEGKGDDDTEDGEGTDTQEGEEADSKEGQGEDDAEESEGEVEAEADSEEVEGEGETDANAEESEEGEVDTQEGEGEGNTEEVQGQSEGEGEVESDTEESEGEVDAEEGEGQGEGESVAEDGETDAGEAEEGGEGEEDTTVSEGEESQVEELKEGCRNIREDVLDVEYNTDKSVLDQDLPNPNSIYGFSFYFRWLSRFPSAMMKGIETDERYHVATLGEGAISLYLGAGGFHIESVNENQEHIFKNLGHGDIEGKWVLVYVGASGTQVHGFVQVEGEEIQEGAFDVTVTSEAMLKFIVGGSRGEVKSFQGQVARIQAFNDEVYESKVDFTKFVSECYGIPTNIYSSEKRLTILVERNRDFVSTQTFDQSSVFENKEFIMADEYSVSGWMKWSDIQEQNLWHSGFRLTINQQDINENFRQIGDRDLSFFVGDKEKLKSHVAFCTYSYRNDEGDAEQNKCKLVPYADNLSKWFYVYFGYQRSTSQAFAYIEFTEEMAQINFSGIRHYYSGKVLLYLGQDKFYPPFSGTLSNWKINFFNGSYRLKSYDATFGYFPVPIEKIDPSKQLDEGHPVEPPAVESDECDELVEITVLNASDVVCALSNYLTAVAQGNDPSKNKKAKKFCFCLIYEEEDANPELLMMAQLLGAQMKPKHSSTQTKIMQLMHQHI